jgi:hypothetical protein
MSFQSTPCGRTRYLRPARRARENPPKTQQAGRRPGRSGSGTRPAMREARTPGPATGHHGPSVQPNAALGRRPDRTGPRRSCHLRDGRHRKVHSCRPDHHAGEPAAVRSRHHRRQRRGSGLGLAAETDLVVLDNFDDNLSQDSGRWTVRDPALAARLAGWTGKLLITCRHPFCLGETPQARLPSAGSGR